MTRQLVAAVAAGELDLALVALPIDDPRLELEPLFTEPLLLAMAAGHRLARRRRLSIDDLRTELEGFLKR